MGGAGADFAGLDGLGGAAKQYGRNAERWLGKGFVRPEGCFVFEEDGGGLVGGVCFAAGLPTELEIMDFALTEPTRPDGPALLSEGIRLAGRPEARMVSYNLYDDGPTFSDIRRLFLAAGFAAAQEKKSYTYEKETPPPVMEGLAFKSVAQTGEALFLETVQRVTVGTLDSLMAADAAALGADEAARIYVDGLKTLHYDSDWWRLAYQGDDLVGLIVPQRLGDTVGAINYIGVLPERRGRGHVNALLAEGTRVLTEHGVKKIYADIDTANEPMARALEGMGYVFQTAEVVLVRGV